jgi:Leucine-rich repeat (LRR) protein
MTVLHLQNNKLSDLSPSIEFCTQLTDLDISNNYLTTLPLSLEKVQSLTK